METPILTKAQSRIYTIIRDYIHNHGYAPTIREIADIAGYASLSGVHWHVKRLVQKGYIFYETGRYRTLRVVK